MRLARLPAELRDRVAAFCDARDLAHIEGLHDPSAVSRAFVVSVRTHLTRRLLLPALTFAPDADDMHVSLTLRARAWRGPFLSEWPMVGGSGSVSEIRVTINRWRADDATEVTLIPLAGGHFVDTDRDALRRLLGAPEPEPEPMHNQLVTWSIADSQPRVLTALVAAILRVWGEEVEVPYIPHAGAREWRVLEAVRALSRTAAKVNVAEIFGTRIPDDVERRLRALGFGVVNW
jgi:hypothetical protein